MSERDQAYKEAEHNPINQSKLTYQYMVKVTNKNIKTVITIPDVKKVKTPFQR